MPFTAFPVPFDGLAERWCTTSSEIITTIGERVEVLLKIGCGC